MRKIYLWLLLLMVTMPSHAQQTYEGRTRQAVALNSFWSNWYVQVGLDMTLQNPYGYNFRHVFPNGKTFGVDVAGGKWFTPVVGLRGRFNWENGIGFLENGHAAWLAPFYDYGKNMDRGGYITMVGDIQLDVHNLLWEYKADRLWNLQAFFRAGGLYNFGVSKGSPLLGLGLGNTFRVDDRFKIYFDVAYSFVSSGHAGVAVHTGTGSNSNGFLDFNLGLQINLGKSTFTPVLVDE